jgi:hypothetical protein
MAKQKGVIKVQGTLDDLTFSRTRIGFMAGMKTRMDGGRILTDPKFARTRENMGEFGQACKAGKMIRKALRSLVKESKDPTHTTRLMKKMREVIKADTTSPRGLRNVIDGETELLKGFEFNGNTRLEISLSAPVIAGINRVTGEASVQVQPFIPTEHVVAPEGATHFRIVSAGAEINFEAGAFQSSESQTAIMPIDNVLTAAINQVNALPAASTHPLFLALGIQYFQRVNGFDYPLKSGAFNALSLVEVSGV